jgi:type IV secretion system protein VirB10
MTVDVNTTPTEPNTIGSGAVADDIVSVNAHGRRRNNQTTVFVMIGLIALVVLLGGVFSLNLLRQKLSGAKAKPTTEAATKVAMTFDTDATSASAAPPLPGTASAASDVTGQRLCPDGSPGNELRGTDGVVVRNASGQSVKVCANGQVVGYSPTQTVAARPIPVVRSERAPAGQYTASQSAAGQRTDGWMMLNDGHYGAAQAALNANPQALLQQVAQQTSDATSPPKGEGLLTAPRADSLEAQLQPSRTPLVQAARITNLSMLLPKGKSIECGMSMRIISSLAGQASCVVTQNVYSADGKVVLLERGSEAVGEYRSGVSIGQRRLFVLWTRIMTPSGVVINLDSPGADELGSTGLSGTVDSHWWQRFGSAFLLSTIQDGIQYEIAQEQAKSGGSTVVLSNTAQAGNSMASSVLQSTINIPPTIYKNQGDRAVIYVARDLDFSNVYRLRAK